MGRITVFSLSTCAHCKRAKALLHDRGYEYTDISLSDYPEKRTDMLVLADRLTVPQIFFNDKHIGGASDLVEMPDAELVQLYEEMAAAPDPTNPKLQKPTHAPKPALVGKPRGQDQLICIGDACASYVEVLEVIRSNVSIETRKYCLKSYPKCFLGSDLVDMLMSKYALKSREEAVQVGLSLQQSGVFDHVVAKETFADSAKLLFRLQADAEMYVLNRIRIWSDRVDEPMLTVQLCTTRLSKMVSENTDSDGLVDYVAVSEHSDFSVFEEAVCELQKVKLEDMDENTRLAFCINLYNMVVLHAFAKVGAPNTNLQRNAFFGNASYDIGGHVLSLNDIENGILRANRAPPYHLRAPFGSGDPRLSLALPKHEPCIHFALNCGAKSCPPVRMFTAEAVQEELRIVAMAALEQDENCKVDLEHQTLWLTKILSWFRADFGDDDASVARMVLQWVRGEKKASLEKLLSGDHFRIRHYNYDWSNNAKRTRMFESTTNCRVM